MWRIILVLSLLFVTVHIAYGEEPYINPAQEVVIRIDKFSRQVYDKYKNFRPLRKIEEKIPLTDFRFYAKPKMKSIEVGFKFTF